MDHEFSHQLINLGIGSLSCNEETVINVFPSIEISSPFFRNHPSWKPPPNLKSKDCTHICWTPNFYESIWHGIYIAVNQSSCKDLPPNFPSGPLPGKFEKKHQFKKEKIQANALNTEILGKIFEEITSTGS